MKKFIFVSILLLITESAQADRMLPSKLYVTEKRSCEASPMRLLEIYNDNNRSAPFGQVSIANSDKGIELRLLNEKNELIALTQADGHRSTVNLIRDSQNEILNRIRSEYLSAGPSQVGTVRFSLIAENDKEVAYVQTPLFSSTINILSKDDQSMLLVARSLENNTWEIDISESAVADDVSLLTLFAWYRGQYYENCWIGKAFNSVLQGAKSVAPVILPLAAIGYIGWLYYKGAQTENGRPFELPI